MGAKVNETAGRSAFPALKLIEASRHAPAVPARQLGVAADMAVLCAVYADLLRSLAARDHRMMFDATPITADIVCLRGAAGPTLAAAGRTDLADLLERQETLWRSLGHGDRMLACVECALALHTASEIGGPAFEATKGLLASGAPSAAVAYADATELAQIVLGASPAGHIPAFGGIRSYPDLAAWVSQHLGGEAWMEACGRLLKAGEWTPDPCTASWIAVFPDFLALLKREKEMQHPDGPHEENEEYRFWWRSHSDGLRPDAYKLARCLWRNLEGAERVDKSVVRGALWPVIDTEPDQGLKQALYWLNECLRALGVPWEYGSRGGTFGYITKTRQKR